MFAPSLVPRGIYPQVIFLIDIYTPAQGWDNPRLEAAMSPVTTLTSIGIAAFAIDRIVTAAMFLLSYLFASRGPSETQGATTRPAAEKKQKLWYFVLACGLAAAVLIRYPEMRLLAALQIKESGFLDAFLTGIVLVAGTDRIAAFLKPPSVPTAEKPESQPIQVVGKLTLEEGTAKRMAAGQGY